MNIFHKITRKSLSKNRTRTIVTIIGIALSMALFTAVIEGAYSGVQFLLRGEVEQTGSYHAFYYDVPESVADELVDRDDIKDYSSWQLVGWSNIDSVLDNRPYIALASISDNFQDFVSIRLTEGRLPENENEIIIPSNMAGFTSPSYFVGDKITLSVGKRMADDLGLGLRDSFYVCGPEEITEAEEHAYTIVGEYECFNYEMTPIAAYLGLTKGPAEGNENIFFTLKNIRNFYTDFANNQPLGIPYQAHDDLMLYSGLVHNDNLMLVLYGFVTILVCLIFFGSVSLIYNSFAISVSERTKQFGVLKSIGATKKQIRKSVLYEAFVVAGIGIPVGLVVGCVGIGITFRCLQDAFARILNYSNAAVKISLVLNPAALLAAAAVCLVTVLVSALIPAKRSAKINAIDAIRQTDDMKIKGKVVKTSKLTTELFGFEGMMASKNFKRNKKRYRSTVFSLFLSIVLFISATSFSSYLTSAIAGVSSSDPRSDIRYCLVSEDMQSKTPEDVFTVLSSASGVTEGLYLISSTTSLYTDLSNFDSLFKQRPSAAQSEDNSDPYIYGNLAFVNDDMFRSVCKENHLNADDYFDPAHPTGIIYNNSVDNYQENENEPSKWCSYKNLDESKLPCTLSKRTYREIEGYAIQSTEAENEGNFVVYYPEDYLDEMYRRMVDEEIQFDKNLAMKLPIEEAVISTELVVNAVIKDTLFAFPSDTAAVIYPYSMKAAVLDADYENKFSSETVFAFRCDNHQKTYTDMEELLRENGMSSNCLHDEASGKEAERTLVTIIKVFTYGFIILISLIAIANVFNTISTNIMLRRREFAMLKSIGLSERGFRRMMDYECIIYGLKGLVYGLTVAVLISYAIYRVADIAFSSGFYIPWPSIVIAVGSVFIVVFVTMLYATRKIRKDNPIDAMKNENS